MRWLRATVLHAALWSPVALGFAFALAVDKHMSWGGALLAGIMSTIPAAVRQFQNLSAQKLLTGPALTGVSSLKEIHQYDVELSFPGMASVDWFKQATGVANIVQGADEHTLKLSVQGEMGEIIHVAICACS